MRLYIHSIPVLLPVSYLPPVKEMSVGNLSSCCRSRPPSTILLNASLYPFRSSLNTKFYLPPVKELSAGNLSSCCRSQPPSTILLNAVSHRGSWCCSLRRPTACWPGPALRSWGCQSKRSILKWVESWPACQCAKNTQCTDNHGQPVIMASL